MRTSLFCLTVLALAMFGSAQTSAPAKAPLAQRINQPVNASAIANAPLEKVLQQYARDYGLNFVVDWQALKTTGVTRQTPVSLAGGKFSIAQALDLTLRAVPSGSTHLAWRVMGDEILISTQMRVLLANHMGQLTIFAKPLTTAAGSASHPAGPLLRPASSASEFNFDNVPLSVVLDNFRDTAKVNFHVNWRSLELSGITRDTPVTLKVRDVSVARAMDLVFDGLNAGKDRLAGVYWVAEEGVVEVATGAALNNTTNTKVYDVGDVLIILPSFDEPSLNTSGGANSGGMGGGAGTSSGGSNGGMGGSSGRTGGSYGGSAGSGSSGNSGSSGAAGQPAGDTLIAVIKESIGLDMWQPTGKGDVKLRGTQLIITQSPLGFKLLEQAFRG